MSDNSFDVWKFLVVGILRGVVLTATVALFIYSVVWLRYAIQALAK